MTGAGTTLAPLGDDDLVDFTFNGNVFPEGTAFTVSLGTTGYFDMVDSTGALVQTLSPYDPTNNPNGVQPLTFAAVPEPSSIIALLGGLGSLLVFRRRRA